MTKPFAVIIGVCFIALGFGRLALLQGHEGVYGILIISLFIVAGIACLFYRP